MKDIRFSAPIIVLICLFGLFVPACSDMASDNGVLEPTSQIVQTIPAATLTAISELAAPSPTADPDAMEIDWSEMEGQELEFWYLWDLDEPGAGMNEIVDRFNQENEWGITVIAHDQGLVLDPLGSVESALIDGKLPDIMVGESSVIADWYQSGLIVDLSPFIKDPTIGMTEQDLAAFYPGIFNDFALDGTVRPGMPFSQSIQVIYYNSSWAEELNFSSDPLNADELREQICSSSEEDAPAGLVLSPQAANILSFIYAYRGDPSPLPDGEYRFSSRRIKEFAEDWRNISLDGCGQLISNYPNPMAIEREYERFNQRQALMIMGSSLMQTHIQPEPVQIGKLDTWRMLPFIGPDGTKAVTSEVQSVVIFNSSPETEAASWLFLKYLTSAEVQADWSEYSEYYPTRKDSTLFLREFRENNPAWASGLNLLSYGRSAPLHPSWQTVKLAVEDAFEEILANPEIDLDDQLDLLEDIAEELLDWIGNEEPNPAMERLYGE
jgi:ABC-type glycerol-3-phosphate transport system substrate-binding protein